MKPVCSRRTVAPSPPTARAEPLIRPSISPLVAALPQPRAHAARQRGEHVLVEPVEVVLVVEHAVDEAEARTDRRRHIGLHDVQHIGHEHAGHHQPEGQRARRMMPCPRRRGTRAPSRPLRRMQRQHDDRIGKEAAVEHRLDHQGRCPPRRWPAAPAAASPPTVIRAARAHARDRVRRHGRARPKGLWRKRSGPWKTRENYVSSYSAVTNTLAVTAK